VSTTTLSTRAYFGKIAHDTEPETYSLVWRRSPLNGTFPRQMSGGMTTVAGGVTGINEWCLHLIK
ncbi:hypothetical protein LINGRAHAP2_LOCUS20054, partial [Linum grandiflorum]